MALPFWFIALFLGGYGAKKCVDAHGDQQRASALNDEASLLLATSRRRLQQTRSECAILMQHLGQLKLELADQQLGRFIRLAQTVRQVEVPVLSPWMAPMLAAGRSAELVQLRDAALQAHHFLRGGALALGSGALVSIASYGLTMTFASASTGTAIASLSGAAATNATLAWLGGGSLAAGGLGMAGGSVVLGLLVAGPAIAVGGSLWAAKARENLALARVNLAEARRAASEMDAAISVLQGVGRITDQFGVVLSALEGRAILVFNSLESLLWQAGTDYQRYNPAQRQHFWAAFEFARALKQVLDLPLFPALEDSDLEGSPALAAAKLLLGPRQGR